ncbi:sodium/glutamate symporter [Romboutsia sp. 1001713B170207_170306_H8]|uniref:sodium/glutamate symporter n=1 Tax=Romboutsia sp. 1001713B170207_170306_H8 TaxID=2787112 RepID=UPI0018983798|nr:sodium/glutamate symporter [Romboutsia sp. 1001713B170207_170306_H8]
MFDINLNSTYTFLLAVILFLFGSMLKNKIKIFNSLCIPSPVIGGVFFCLLYLFLNYFNIFNVTMDTRIMPKFMSFFFTAIGLSVSLSLIKKGGKLLLKYWLLCGILAFCQNTLTVVLSKVCNIHPLLGLMCGTISMEGGHGYAAAFGATIESLGIKSASSVGIASATIGLILGGILGGPTAKFLIEKYKLKPTSNKTFNISNNSILGISKSYFGLTPYLFFEQVLIVLLCMVLGEFITNLIYNTFHVVVPTIVCSMFIAVIFRNINDRFNIIKIDFQLLDFLSELCLGMFLTMALMSVDLLKLSNLFAPIIFIISCQVIFIILYAILICFRFLGKNFDAAIIISGLIGHGLGATPNALANMTSVSQKYGYSEKAFLVVPLVGAFLLDLFTMPCIILFINLLS